MIRYPRRLLSALPRRFAMLVTAALALAGVVALPAAPALAASNVQVFVGYADNLRANPVDFPTPWAGSPSIVVTTCGMTPSGVQFVPAPFTPMSEVSKAPLVPPQTAAAIAAV